MPFKPDKEHFFAHITTEKAPFGILWHDIEGNFVRVNREAARLLGYTQEELLTKRVMDIDAFYTLELMEKLWDTIYREGVHHFESTQIRKDGTRYPAELVTVIFTFDEKDYACTFFRDVSEKKEREGKLRKALIELEEAKKQLTCENVYLKEEIGQTYNSREIIGNSSVLTAVLKRVEQVAKTRATVLILGETGTGKELIARSIHEQSDRRDRSLVKVNCAALPATLIESELFGHEKGAFTGATSAKAGKFELADKGTIFLDEIGEMPLELQAKFLRVLQEGEFERLGSEQVKRVDVRVIAATNRNLQTQINNGEFREDLYYRLNVFPIICPPLRNRKEDIPGLANYFIKKYSGEIGKKIDVLPESEVKKLVGYHWPGNLREFQNVIESSVITSVDGVFKLETCSNLFNVQSEAGEESMDSLEDVERSHIIKVLDSTGWRVSGEKGAARILGMNSQTLTSRMKKLEISRTRTG